MQASHIKPEEWQAFRASARRSIFPFLSLPTLSPSPSKEARPLETRRGPARPPAGAREADAATPSPRGVRCTGPPRTGRRASWDDSPSPSHRSPSSRRGALYTEVSRTSENVFPMHSQFACFLTRVVKPSAAAGLSGPAYATSAR